MSRSSSTTSNGDPATSAIVELKGVHKTFGSHAVLRGVDLAARPRETLVIIGRSGTGKSVTLRHVVGLEKPDQGDVSVFGYHLDRASKKQIHEIRSRTGFLFQSGALLNWMTIEENVALPLVEHERRISAAEVEARVLEKLRLVGMESARRKLPSEISGGMKKRAALARATVLNPDLVLYDEPTSGLDPVIASFGLRRLCLRTRIARKQLLIEEAHHSAKEINLARGAGERSSVAPARNTNELGADTMRFQVLCELNGQ